MSRLQQIKKDINWKYLAISSGLALLLALAVGLTLSLIQEKAFIYWFNNFKTASTPEVKDVQNLSQNFLDSYYWIPAYILLCFIVQTISSVFLAKKSPENELTNGLALGVVCMVIVYQFDPILSIFSVIFSILASYKIKSNRLKLLNNP